MRFVLGCVCLLPILFSNFNITRLLRYNSHTRELAHLKYAIQVFLALLSSSVKWGVTKPSLAQELRPPLWQWGEGRGAFQHLSHS